MAWVLLNDKNVVIGKSDKPFLGWIETYEDVTEDIEKTIIDPKTEKEKTVTETIVVGQKLVSQEPYPDEPYIEAPDDSVVGQIKQKDGSYKNPDVSDDQKWVQIRAKRDALLAQSDWTQINDSPLNQEQRAEWISYRGVLRDITNANNPDDISWPEKPE